MLEIEVLDRTESVRILRDRATDVSLDEADRLAERLGDFPLAVEQVAMWHQATGVPVANYLDDLDEQMRSILSDRRAPVANYPATVSGFLRVAFAQLAEAAPAAAQLLELFAWLGAEPLSLTLLRSGRQGAVTVTPIDSWPVRSIGGPATRVRARLVIITCVEASHAPPSTSGHFDGGVDLPASSVVVTCGTSGRPPRLGPRPSEPFGAAACPLGL